MNTTSTEIPRWTYAFAIAAVALALASLFFRHKVEHRNNAVAMAVEGDVAESLGASQGLNFKDSLRALKAKGFNSVVLSEETVGELVSSGQIRVDASSGKIDVEGTPATVARVERGVILRSPASGFFKRNEAGSKISITGTSPSVLRTVAVGINPDEAKTARGLGMTIIARCVNPSGANEACVTGTLDWAHELGATIFLPMGDQVLGRRDALQPFIDKLKALGMLYASPEFGKIGGDSNVMEEAPEIVVRLQSAQAAELDKMTPAETVERYVLAGRERDVRVLLLRPLSYSGSAPLTAFGDLGHSVGKELQKEGGELHAPHAYADPKVPRLIFALLAFAIAATSIGILATFTVSRPVHTLALAVCLLLGVGSMYPHGRPFAALLAAIAFPVLAFLILDRGAAKNIVAEFLLVSLVSLAGGLCVAGMLNELPYFIRADQFFGVKAAQFTPIALVGAYFFVRLCEVRGVSKNPVLWGQVLLGLALIAGLGLMWMRSGNDNPAAVSGVELKFRSLLERFLVVRPRTKEIFIGHPLMIIGIAILMRARLAGLSKPRNGGWIALALTGGAIGQTSIVNTMCHLHTPLEVGLTRILVGLVLGGILGLVLWAIIKRVTPETEG